MFARYSFSDIFKENADGTISAKTKAQIGGATIAPEVKFTEGISWGGIDIFDYLGQDLMVEKEKGVSIIRGFFGV